MQGYSGRFSPHLEKCIDLGQLVGGQRPIRALGVGQELRGLVAPEITELTSGWASSQACASSVSVWPCAVPHVSSAASLS